MAAYCREDDLIVTCGLTACITGSALDPTFGNEYRKPLPYLTSSYGGTYPIQMCSYNSMSPVAVFHTGALLNGY